MKQIKIIDSVFLTSAQSIQDSPPPNKAEIAFLGRSNVGKSSLLNSLTKRKTLAKSSSTPGKTQLINFFDITFKDYNATDDIEKYYARFVDLPGFGYAKVSKSTKQLWHKNLTQYLQERESLQIFVHLIDARHPALQIDQDLKEFLAQIKKADQIIVDVFTKIDKLKSTELQKLKQKYPNGIFVSNLKNKGLQQLEQKITNYLFGQ